MGWGSQQGRDGHPVGDRDLADGRSAGQGAWGQAHNGAGYPRMDTQQAKDPRAWAMGGAETQGYLKPCRGQACRGRECPEPPDGAKTLIKAEHSLGQGALVVGTGHPLGTGHLLGTGCPQWWGTCWVEGTHGRDMEPMGDRGHLRGCSQVPPLPIGARQGQGCAQWTRLTATSARPAGSRSACRLA